MEIPKQMSVVRIVHANKTGRGGNAKKALMPVLSFRKSIDNVSAPRMPSPLDTPA